MGSLAVVKRMDFVAFAEMGSLAADTCLEMVG
jgi:hypothetical protein